MTTKRLSGVALVLCLVMQGWMACTSTIVPPLAPLPAAPSWDGTHQDGGHIGLIFDAAGHQVGQVVSQFWVDRYHARLKKYGPNLSSAASAVADPMWGITPHTPLDDRVPAYAITNALQQLNSLMAAKEEGRAP